MIVVHTAMLREFRLAPQCVARVPAGAHRAARRVNAHLELMCDLLHHHHAGEDELLWPPLRALLTADGQARLDEAEAQHTDIDAALRLVNTARHRWTDLGDDGSRDELIAALHHLHGLLVTHLDTEERELLPLAAAHLTPGQWAAVGEAGAAAVPKSKMLLVFGMFAYEGDPERPHHHAALRAAAGQSHRAAAGPPDLRPLRQTHPRHPPALKIAEAGSNWSSSGDVPLASRIHTGIV